MRSSCRPGPDSVFVTGIVGQVDLEKRELQIVSAGHQPPSVLIEGSPVPLPPECLTRPWGLDFDSPWEVGQVALGQGDWSILCYTDGVTEGPRRRGLARCAAGRRLSPRACPAVR